MRGMRSVKINAKKKKKRQAEGVAKSATLQEGTMVTLKD